MQKTRKGALVFRAAFFNSAGMPISKYLRHAFSTRSWTSIGGLVVGAWATLWQLNLNVSDPDFMILASAMTVLALGSWLSVIREAAENDKLHDKLDDIIRQIAAGMTLPPRVLSVRNLRDASNRDLADMVANLAKDIREFGHARMRELMARPQFDRGGRDEWQEYTRQITEGHRRYAAEFNEQLRPDALALREEMQRRVGNSYVPPPAHESVALDAGMLAGVNPEGDAADILEELARRLPD